MCYLPSPHPPPYTHILNSIKFLMFLSKPHEPGVVVHALITALRRERKVDFCEFKANPVYKKSSRPAEIYSEILSKSKNKN